MITIYATGHRPKDLPGGYDLNHVENQKLMKTLMKILFQFYQKYGSIEIVSGMALGVDMIYFLAAYNLNKKYNCNFILHACIPHENQTNCWPEHSKKLWTKLRSMADKETICHDGEFQMWHLNSRNKIMADMSDICISVWSGKKGGTYNATKYSITKGQPVIHINPFTYKVQKLTKKEFNEFENSDKIVSTF